MDFHTKRQLLRNGFVGGFVSECPSMPCMVLYTVRVRTPVTQNFNIFVRAPFAYPYAWFRTRPMCIPMTCMVLYVPRV